MSTSVGFHVHFARNERWSICDRTILSLRCSTANRRYLDVHWERTLTPDEETSNSIAVQFQIFFQMQSLSLSGPLCCGNEMLLNCTEAVGMLQILLTDTHHCDNRLKQKSFYNDVRKASPSVNNACSLVEIRRRPYT